jgi:hypothetical protein
VTEEQQPTFYSLSTLYTISEIIKAMLESSEVQLKNMTEVIDKPHVSDDEIIKHSLKIYNNQSVNIDLYLEQCRRWRKDLLAILN